MALFDAGDLRAWLRYDADDVFDESSVTIIEQVVSGWLEGALGADPASFTGTGEQRVLKAWALELGGMAWENPTYMAGDQSGETQSSWFATTRQSILDRAAEWASGRGDSGSVRVPSPLGRFPAAQPWPDPGTARTQPRRGTW